MIKSSSDILWEWKGREGRELHWFESGHLFKMGTSDEPSNVHREARILQILASWEARKSLNHYAFPCFNSTHKAASRNLTLEERSRRIYPGSQPTFGQARRTVSAFCVYP